MHQHDYRRFCNKMLLTVCDPAHMWSLPQHLRSRKLVNINNQIVEKCFRRAASTSPVYFRAHPATTTKATNRISPRALSLAQQRVRRVMLFQELLHGVEEPLPVALAPQDVRVVPAVQSV